ncbi:MAG TPA: helix-turn-helix domain-containing protein [Clostridiales bacterium]|nr:helix-turn-helix domain-containing protein [Clostridiales bacterium]
MSIAENIKKLREDHGLTQRELGIIAGVSDKAISSWERGSKEPRMGAIQRLADHFGIKKSDIIDGTPTTFSPCLDVPCDFTIPRTRKVPLIKELSDDITLVAQYEDRLVSIPESIQADFAYRCKDESLLSARVYPGDILFIRRQPRVESGSLAALYINGEVYIRRIYRYPDQLVLVAENPDYPPLIFNGADKAQVRSLGVVVAFVGMML